MSAMADDEVAATQEPGGGGGRLNLGLVRWIDHRIERLEDKLGADIRDVRRQVANLADRTDARFAASDAKMDARLAEWDAKTEARLTNFDERFTDCEAKVDARFAPMDSKLECKSNLSIALLIAILTAALANLIVPHL